MNKLSVIVITRNEEKNIKRCLDSVKWADEIIVVDSYSTDKTVELARGYTDKIFLTEPKGFAEPDREFAVSKTANGWVFLIDADEEISAGLKAEIQSALAAPAHEVYMVPRKTFFGGKPVTTCGWYPSYIPRLFKKGKVFFPARTHADGDVLTGRVAHLKQDLLHYTYSSVSDWMDKFNHNTDLAAVEQFKDGKKITVRNILRELLIRPLYFFLLKYFVLKGYRGGWRGFFVSASSALVVVFVFIKLWELHEMKSGAG